MCRSISPASKVLSLFYVWTLLCSWNGDTENAQHPRMPSLPEVRLWGWVHVILNATIIFWNKGKRGCEGEDRSKTLSCMEELKREEGRSVFFNVACELEGALYCCSRLTTWSSCAEERKDSCCKRETLQSNYFNDLSSCWTDLFDSTGIALLVVHFLVLKMKMKWESNKSGFCTPILRTRGLPYNMDSVIAVFLMGL